MRKTKRRKLVLQLRVVVNTNEVKYNKSSFYSGDLSLNLDINLHWKTSFKRLIRQLSFVTQYESTLSPCPTADILPTYI